MVTHDDIDSTNAEARRLAKSHGVTDLWPEDSGGSRSEDGGLWIVAARQSAGRGRRGRVWVSEAGNFFGSLLIKPEIEAREAAKLGFLAGVALYDALKGLVGSKVELNCKWPNDILADGAKLAGILLEASVSGKARPDWVVIGIGVNLVHSPEVADYPASDLESVSGCIHSPAEFLARLAPALDDWLGIWRAEGFGPIKTAWLARASGLGQTITAKLEGETLQGIFADLTDDGALVLRQPDGTTREILAADIFPGTH